MNIEKLKPWNWFKHEDDLRMQTPVSETTVAANDQYDAETLTTQKNQAAGSLMQLHHEMDRLFDDVWRSFGMPSRSRLMRPASLLGNGLSDNSILGNFHVKLDIAGSDKEYEVSIDLPGLSEDDIQIELKENALLVKGNNEVKNESHDKHYYRVERSIGSFQRTLSLPEDANVDKVSASMKNGLLLIHIPRKALSADDTKHISISS